MSQDQANVLLIDDDVQLCEMLQSYLTRHGWQVKATHSGEDGLRLAQEWMVDLIVLDGMLPDLDGLDVLRKLRTTSTIPVLLLTARGEEVDRIIGLELGADDYIGKPFNPRELLARMRAILRRALPRDGETLRSTETSPDFAVDEGKREISFRKKLVPLTDIEYALLSILLKNLHKVVSREELTEEVFERPLRPFDRSLDMHVSRLRKKLEALPKFEGTIKSVRSSGYIFVQYESGEEPN